MTPMHYAQASLVAWFVSERARCSTRITRIPRDKAARFGAFRNVFQWISMGYPWNFTDFL